MTSLAPGWRKIVGHGWAVRLLNSVVINEQPGHAYLITGPDHIGKMTLARTFAQALNCAAPLGSRPCGECRACRLIAEDKHPDVRVILPEISARGAPSIKIEQIRQLQQELSLSAYEVRYKVAILRRFDAANINAANAFLKTLEEPPSNVILLLTAADADTLLPTINSRCRAIRLRPIATSLIEETLMTTRHVKTEEANLLAHLADGRLGWAVRAHEDATLLKEREAHLDSLYQGLGGSLVGRFSLAETLSRKAESLPPMLTTWLSWWRDVALLAYGRRVDEALSNIDQVELIHEMAGRWPRGGVLSALQQTEAAIRQLGQNANARLVLENVLLAYPSKN
jgi:DNA polymerase-3 subunit delta'